MLNAAGLEERTTGRMRARQVPGLAIAVGAGRGGGLHQRLWRDEPGRGGAALTVRPLFHIGCTTNPFSSTMILRLVEAGVLDLGHPVGDYAPEPRFSETGVERIITVQMLLSHRSGLQSSAAYSGPRGPDRLVRALHGTLATRRFVAPPGSLP